MEEIWKDIKGYEGSYQVSNLGRVRSLDRETGFGYGRTRIIRGRILKLSITTAGYYTCALSIYGKPNQVLVHRLVAEAFIPNLDGKSDVDHLDGDFKNNRVDNLQWVTPSENRNYAIDKGFYIPYIPTPRSVSVLQYDLDGNFIQEFNSIRAAANYMRLHPSAVRQCCVGKSSTSGGFVWKYKGTE